MSTRPNLMSTGFHREWNGRDGGHLIMSMGLSDIGKAMSPVRASYQLRVQSQNAVTQEVVDKNKQQQNQTPQLMSSSSAVANNGLRSRGGKVDIKVWRSRSGGGWFMASGPPQRRWWALNSRAAPDP